MRQASIDYVNDHESAEQEKKRLLKICINGTKSAERWSEGLAHAGLAGHH